MTLVTTRFPGGFAVAEAAPVEPSPCPPETRCPHRLRRIALDAVARFRAAVDAADDAMAERGACDLKGWRYSRLREMFEGPVREASKEVEAAIKAAHLAAGGDDFNHLVIDDAGDVLHLCETDYPLCDEQSFFPWPYVTLRASKAIGPGEGPHDV